MKVHTKLVSFYFIQLMRKKKLTIKFRGYVKEANFKTVFLSKFDLFTDVHATLLIFGCTLFKKLSCSQNNFEWLRLGLRGFVH